MFIVDCWLTVRCNMSQPITYFFFMLGYCGDSKLNFKSKHFTTDNGTHHKDWRCPGIKCQSVSNGRIFLEVTGQLGHQSCVPHNDTVVNQLQCLIHFVVP